MARVVQWVSGEYTYATNVVYEIHNDLCLIFVKILYLVMWSLDVFMENVDNF